MFPSPLRLYPVFDVALSAPVHLFLETEATVMDDALCLNCGALVPHERGQHVVMGFRPGITENPDYVVSLDEVEVHRCSGSTSRVVLLALALSVPRGREAARAEHFST